VPYPIRNPDPQQYPGEIIEKDLASGKIDAAIVWGPVAGQLLSQHSTWTSLAFKPDPKIKFDYEISMGLRQGEKDWKDTLDQWIGTHHEQIQSILVGYRIPLLELSAPTPGA
jgi:ABC-type amino acid transport substrate-binding protein